jgi:hypothetical protein
MSNVQDRKRSVKHPPSNRIPWPNRTKALFRSLHVSVADFSLWSRHDYINSDLSYIEVQLIYIAWSDEVWAGRTRARFMGCPLDAIWEWHWRKSGYLRPGYEWLREERRRAA